MPRTKVSKNAKRNRDAAKEETLRVFEATVDQQIASLDSKFQQDIDEIAIGLIQIKQRLPQKMLMTRLGELFSMNIKTVAEFKQMAEAEAQSCRSMKQNSSFLSNGTGKKSRDDEGYLTEDSTASSCATSAYAPLTSLASRGRTPGPLSSAKPKSRRSQSACGIMGSALKQKNTFDHASRSKMRTPNPRAKAISADRAVPETPRQMPESPTALLRWPKPGETVISLCGSPVVSNFAPEKYANVNIPIQNGVLSLRPKKMQSVDPSIIDKIDSETIRQIKLLQSNLNVIMSYADKALL